MKVLVVHNRYREPGGEDVSVNSEVEMLRRHRVAVVKYYDDNRRVDGIGRLRLAAGTVWSRESYRRLSTLVRSERPDLVHINNYFPLISPSAYYACAEQGVPVVQTLRNYRMLCLAATLSRDGRPCERCVGLRIPWPGMVHACYRGSMAASAASCAMLAVHNLLRTWHRQVRMHIALTEFARKKFVEAGFASNQLTVKPNFVYPDPGVGEHRGGFALFVGRLSPEKGIYTLTSAWDRLGGQFPLRIAGGGPLLPMAREWSRRHRTVTVLGSLSPSEVRALMQQATVLLLTSTWYETFGRVAVEAFATGLPVIASRLGAMAEVVEEGRTGLHFVPGDPADLAAKVEAAFRDPGRLAEMGRNARDEFQARYTAEVNYGMLMRIYRQALGAS